VSHSTFQAPLPDHESFAGHPTAKATKGKSKVASMAFVLPDPEDDVFSKIAAHTTSTVAESSHSWGGGKPGLQKATGEFGLAFQ
jgi:hypothetical protein